MRRRSAIAAWALAGLLPATAWAADASSRPVDWIAWLAFAGLGVLALLMLTCFVKIAVVLAVLRSAFGGRAIPPAGIMTGLALVLTFFVMAPVGERAGRAMAPAWGRGDAASLAAAASAGSEPLRDFLLQHGSARERQSFLELQRSLRPPAEREAVSERDLTVLAPAFIVGELRAAFAIGFLLLLPFLILELVVANVLTALGMHTLEARAVSLPFKLLLFVLADGWHLIARGLVLGYT